MGRVGPGHPLAFAGQSRDAPGFASGGVESESIVSVETSLAIVLLDFSTSRRLDLGRP
jgi:hypothetical protein